MNLQDQSGDELIFSLSKKQQGKGYGAEGTCQAGNFVHSIVYFNVPMRSIPTIILSNVQQTNCKNFEIWKISKFAFVVRAFVIINGGAELAFNWDAVI